MKKLMGKYVWILAGVVIVVGVYFMSGKQTGNQYLGIGTASPSPSSATGAVAKPVVKKSVTPTPPVSAQNYSELVKEYEGRRIQFDDRCQRVPKDPTFNNGTSIMIDNRSTAAKAITVGATKYDLGAYGYRIITLSSSSLPKELALSCGSSGTVGKVLLQATILQ